MLPEARKLRCPFALSPELILALNDYSASFEVSRSLFVEEALWIYLGHLDRHQKAISTRRSASSIRLPALLLLYKIDHTFVDQT